MTLSSDEMEELRIAKELLEHPGFAARLGDFVGSSIERGFELLPARWSTAVTQATQKSIEKALDLALWTLGNDLPRAPANWWHRLAVGATGAAGGAFGLPALSIELPVSTTIMLRSIADIARSEGENLQLPEPRLQCVQVLALGGRARDDDGAEIGYFAARAAMARAISDASSHLAKRGMVQTGAPPIIQLISQVASRFSITVSEKAAAQAIPIVGAAGGAMINTLFIGHFQDMARGHFIIRRLERLHGPDEVRRIYALL